MNLSSQIVEKFLLYISKFHFIYYSSIILSSKQASRRALATDEWLRVEGCNNVYALGDCATINQRKVMVKTVSSSDFLLLEFLCCVFIEGMHITLEK